MPHETQEEPQKPRVTSLRQPAEDAREAAEIVGMAEGTNGMLVLPMEVAGVDEMVMLDGKPAMRVCGVDEGDNSAWKSCRNSTKRT